MFYLIPKEPGKDANDLLRDGDKLKELLEQAPIPIAIKSTIKVNKRTREAEYWTPRRPFDLEIESDKLAIEFVKQKLPYTSRGIALRFIKRYGKDYKKVEGLGVCKYIDGKYKENTEEDLYHEIYECLPLLWFEYFLLTAEEDREEFRKLFQKIDEPKTTLDIKKH